MKRKLIILVLLCVLLLNGCGSSSEPMMINDGEISFDSQKSWEIKDKETWEDSFDGEMDFSNYISLLEYTGSNPGTLSIEKADKQMADRMIYQTATLFQSSIEDIGKEQTRIEFQLGENSYGEQEVELLMKLLEDGKLSPEDSNRLRMEILLGETVYSIKTQTEDFGDVNPSDIELLGQNIPSFQYVYVNAMGYQIKETLSAIINKSDLYLFTAWSHEEYFADFSDHLYDLFSTMKINGSSSLAIDSDPIVLSELESLFYEEYQPTALIPENESGFTLVDPSDYTSFISPDVDLGQLTALYEGPSGSVLQIWQSDMNYAKSNYEETMDFMNETVQKHPEDFQTQLVDNYGYSEEEAAYFARIHKSEELSPEEEHDFFQKLFVGDWAYAEVQDGATILGHGSIQTFSKPTDYIELSLNVESNHYQLITSVFPDDQSIYDIRFYGKKESYEKDKEAALTFIQSLKK